jgi:hypothetical protein
VQGILTDKLTLQQLNNDNDSSARMARAADLISLADKVYKAIDALSNL